MYNFSIFAGLLYPGTLVWDEHPDAKTYLRTLTHKTTTRGELARDMREAMQLIPNYLHEVQQDLSDVTDANGRAVAEVN
jgi:hypothetical protein